MRLKDLTTLIYVTSEDECLFIRKTSEGDINYAKYLGIGGHFETDESPEECVLRELYVVIDRLVVHILVRKKYKHSKNDHCAYYQKRI